MKILPSLIFTLGLMLNTQIASATLIGDEIVATWTYNSFIDINTFIVTDNVELSGGWGLGHDLDVGASSISAGFDFNGGLSQGVLWIFSDLDFQGISGGLQNVAVNTNYVGWDNSFVSFGMDFVQIDFLNDVSFDFDTNFFEISLITRKSTVPEPSTFSLLIITLVLTFLVRLNYRKSCLKKGRSNYLLTNN